MPSHRVPDSGTINPWARAVAARRAAGATLLDLTESNPTRVGLAGADTRDLARLAALAATRYDPDPRGLLDARAAVARAYAEREVRVEPEAIILTASTSEAYAYLFALLCDPGEAVAVPRPSYPLFEPLAAVAGVRLAPYRLAYDGRWHLDLDTLERALAPDVRAVVMVQPNHPTGSCLDPSELAAVEALCLARGAAIVSDEVFGDFGWDATLHPPGGVRGLTPAASRFLPSALGARRVPTFVLGGLSKSCGMPQLKLSWVAAAGPEAERARHLEGLEWLADLYLSVATPVQLALEGLLAARPRFQAAVRERLAANLGALAAFLARVPVCDVLAAEGGWVAMLRMPATRSEEAWALELLGRDVVVHPGHFYDFETEPHLVISLIVEPAPFATALERIERTIGSPPC